MIMRQFIAVVGGKHSGKTTIVEKIVPVLKTRGYRVATIKEMVSIQMIDSPEAAKDTWRHSKAGAEIVVALPKAETVLFLKKKLNLNEIVPFLADTNFVVLEGFDKEKVFPKIIVAKTADEAMTFQDGLAVAITGIISESNTETKAAVKIGIPIINANTDAEKLADIAEKSAFTMLPNLAGCASCHPTGECGYVNCYEYAKAIVSEKTKARNCPLDFKDNLLIEVNGVRLPLKDFPQTIIKNALLGMMSSLHGAEEIKTLKIEIKSNNV